MKTIFRKEHLWLIAGGAALGLSFPPFPFPAQLLMFAGFVPLFIVIEEKEKLIEINRSAYLSFFIFNLITLYWVGSWQKQADPFLMISGALLVFVNPAFMLIPTTLYYFSRRILPRNLSLFLIPFFWVCFEYIYMITDASFPWLTLGNALSHFYYFIQAADIIGALGLSMAVLFINVLLTRAWQNRNNKNSMMIYSSGAVIILVLFIGYGIIRTNIFRLSENKIKVGLIQPDLNPWDKWSGGDLNSLLDEYFSLSEKSLKKGADIIVWPETALPVYLFSGEHPEVVNKLYRFLADNRTVLMTGVPWLSYYYHGDKMPPDVKRSKNGDFYYATYNSVVLV
ncbi:MAG: apolipoprotein N-acyltransferase, partial [Methanococcaceae archaeon]